MNLQLAGPWIKEFIEEFVEEDLEKILRGLQERNRFLECLSESKSHFISGEFAHTIPRLDEAIKINDGHGLAHRMMGYACRASGEYARADAEYGRAIQIDSRDHWAFFGRGEAYLLSGKIEHGVADLDHALRLNSDLVIAYHQRALAYLTKSVRSRPWDHDCIVQAWSDMLEARRLAPKTSGFITPSGSSSLLVCSEVMKTSRRERTSTASSRISPESSRRFLRTRLRI